MFSRTGKGERGGLPLAFGGLYTAGFAAEETKLTTTKTLVQHALVTFLLLQFRSSGVSNFLLRKNAGLPRNLVPVTAYNFTVSQLDYLPEFFFRWRVPDMKLSAKVMPNFVSKRDFYTVPGTHNSNPSLTRFPREVEEPLWL